MRWPQGQGQTIDLRAYNLLPCLSGRPGPYEIKKRNLLTHKPLTYRALQWSAGIHASLPLVIGIVGTVVLGLFAFWMTWYVGIVAAVAAGREPDIAVRAPVTLYMMIGYLPVALYYLGRWTDGHLETIRRHFALDLPAVQFPRTAANLVGAAGAITMYGLFLHPSDDPFLLVQPGRWNSEFPFILVGLVMMGWFIFRFMFLLVWTALTVSRTARRIESIDLLDPSLVEPYAQHGVRSSLLAVVCLSISANLWLDPNSPAIATITTLVMQISAAAVALFLPTWGIHQRLSEQKRSELKQVRRVISGLRDPQTRSVDDAQQLRAELALEQRLMEVSEWPFDAGNYARVTLYVFLGLGSWVGAALVERLLESLGP